MPAPTIGQFVNYEAASRKSRLVAFHMFNPQDSLAFIYDVPPAGSSGTYTQMTGTVNGINVTFTSPITVVNGLLLFLNGILQDPALSYSLVGNVVTFNTAPQVGDDVTAVVS